MNIDSGTLAKSGTGNATWIMNLNFEPELILFFLSGKTSGDTENHEAIGYWHGGTDGTLQASSGKSSETRSKAMSHFAATTEKVAFTVTGTDVGEFSTNHTAADVNYNVHWLAIAS